MSGQVTSIVFKGMIEGRSDSFNLLNSPGDFVIIYRGIPRLMILRCPCGCGDDLMINLDTRSGPAWRAYIKKGAYSLYPSYWRDNACGSHFIICYNRIFWCNRGEEDYNNHWSVDEELERIVLKTLKNDEFTHYVVVAEKCELVPWDCLQACKQLVRKNLCLASSGRDNVEFKKLS